MSLKEKQLFNFINHFGIIYLLSLLVPFVLSSGSLFLIAFEFFFLKHNFNKKKIGELKIININQETIIPIVTFDKYKFSYILSFTFLVTKKFPVLLILSISLEKA